MIQILVEKITLVTTYEKKIEQEKATFFQNGIKIELPLHQDILK